MKLPVTKVVLPRDLKGQTNGRLNPELLVDIDGGKLHHRAADAWLAMLNKAKADDIALQPTSSADTYRTLNVQMATFLKRYDNTPRKSKPKKYRGKLWWLKPGWAGAAVPSTSNHGWGLAVDVKSVGQTKLEWLLKNAATYGFSWEAQSEPWHIRYVAGDKVPAAVLTYLHKQR